MLDEQAAPLHSEGPLKHTEVPSSLLKDRSEQLISRIKPARRSEERRTGVANYVCSVITRCFAPVEVMACTFGSVPLKTYLPGASLLHDHAFIEPAAW